MLKDWHTLIMSWWQTLYPLKLAFLDIMSHLPSSWRFNLEIVWQISHKYNILVASNHVGVTNFGKWELKSHIPAFEICLLAPLAIAPDKSSQTLHHCISAQFVFGRKGFCWIALSHTIILTQIWFILWGYFDVSKHTNHIFSVRIWSWQHVSVKFWAIYLQS